jgi:alpha-mannosidase
MYAPAMWKADAGKNAAPAGQLEMMYLFGVSDHGGGPTREDLDTALRIRDPKVVFPKEEFGTAGAYFANLENHLADLNVPTWSDELYFEYHRGVQTTQAETKRHNRKSEVMLLNAEKLASIATLYGASYPKAGFETAWKDLLFNQFHDILPGSGIAINYVDAARKDEQVQRFGREVVANSLRTISARVNTPGTSVLVFNPLSWERTDVVETDVQLPNKITGISVLAPDGKPAPSEVLSTDAATHTVHIRFLAAQVPSTGYKSFRIMNAPAAKPNTALHATPTSLENEFFRIAVDAKTGCITSMVEKASGTEALAAPAPGDGIPAMNPDGKPCGNLLQVFVDKPKQWDAWNIDADFIKQHTDLLDADEVKLVEQSPLRAVIRVKKHFQNSTFEQDITMYAGVPRIDVNMRADWHEKHQLLKVAFPLKATNERATFEIPYGAIERPTTRRTPEEQAKFEVPALRWADLSNATQGFSLLNDSKYGYDAKDNVLRLSLLRAPEWPDPHADEGKHEFTYSLYPHAKDWKSALTVHRGYELNYPLLAYFTAAHTGTLPATHSFVATDTPGVVITAIKQAEDGNDLLVRMYEWAGKPANVKLSLPPNVTASGATNLMEADEEASSMSSSPFEIKTVRLKITGGSH